ncbi:hypothetical protein EAG_04283 [Camponotus floridanus]|uniref:Uncharacterized protein n=1 Tax=Camponotus floridanus TaxID=104421 RepID=E2A6S9_CAMFO|nr:hypothetical protein EAG_04283 [Camponotus floridanus]
MTNKSESPDRAFSSIDSNSVARPKDKTSLRLRLGHIFSSSGFKSPKSPKSVSSSRGSSPSHGSPRARMRYSWQLGTSDGEDNRSPRSPESGISSFSSSSKSSSIGMNAISSPKSPSTPKSPCSSIWHIDREVEKIYEILGLASAVLGFEPRKFFISFQRFVDISVHFIREEQPGTT